MTEYGNRFHLQAVRDVRQGEVGTPSSLAENGLTGTRWFYETSAKLFQRIDYCLEIHMTWTKHLRRSESIELTRSRLRRLS